MRLGCLRQRRETLQKWSLVLSLFSLMTCCQAAVLRTVAVRPATTKLITQLQARILALEQRDVDIKKLHQDINILKGDIGSLKNSRALTHHLLRTTKEEQTQNTAALDDKIELLRKHSHRIEDAVMTLGELEKTLGERLKKQGDAQTATGLTLAMLSQANKGMKSSLRELAEASVDHKTGLTELRKKITELEVRFAGLSTDVMEKVASVDMMVGPELKEIRSSQTNLAQSLSLLTKKMMLLSPKIPYLQRQLSANTGKVEGLSRNLNDFHKEIQLITDRVGLTEEQLKKFVDPASPINTERRRLITKLRAEVSLLHDGQDKLKAGSIAAMNDRSKLYKHIAGLRVSRKILVEKVAQLEEAVDHFTRDLRHLIVEGPRSQVVSHILSRQESAVEALKSLREAQLDIRNILQEHGTAIAGNHDQLAEHQDDLETGTEALKKVQLRVVDLFNLIHKIKAIMATHVDLAKVDQYQEDTEVTLQHLTQAQTALQDHLAAYASRMTFAESRLDKSSNGLDLLQAELDKIREQTQKLAAAIKWKVVIHDKNLHQDTLNRLKELSQRQENVATILNDYSTSLADTQAELMAQRHAHATTRLTTHSLGEKLRQLHHKIDLTRIGASAHSHQIAAENAHMRNQVGYLGDSLESYRLALSNAQHQLGNQRLAHLGLSSKASNLRRKLIQLQSVVANLRLAMSRPQNRKMVIEHMHDMQAVREAIAQVATELHHYKHDLVNTHAELNAHRQGQLRSSYANGALWHQFRRLQNQLAILENHAKLREFSKARQDDHEDALRQTRGDIDHIAETLGKYNDVIAKTQDELKSHEAKLTKNIITGNELRHKVNNNQNYLRTLARNLAREGPKVY